MFRFLLPLPLMALSQCGSDETISGYANPSAIYALQEIDGAAFPASATIRFPEPGRVEGEAPCNSFGGAQAAPYPWIEFGPLAVTRRACSDLPAETIFFEALAAMSIAEISGGVLILSSEDGREMVFHQAE